MKEHGCFSGGLRGTLSKRRSSAPDRSHAAWKSVATVSNSDTTVSERDSPEREMRATEPGMWDWEKSLRWGTGENTGNNVQWQNGLESWKAWHGRC